MAVAAPRLATTLLDSRGKKTAFLATALDALGLSRVRVLTGRGGELAGVRPRSRRRYDLVTARAVATLAHVLDEVRDLAAPGACLVVYKGPGLRHEEVAKGRSAAKRLGFTLCGIEELRVESLSPKLVVFRRPTPRS